VPRASKGFVPLDLFLVRSPDAVTHSEVIEHVRDIHFFDSGTNLIEAYFNRVRQKIGQRRSMKLIPFGLPSHRTYKPERVTVEFTCVPGQGALRHHGGRREGR